jgi:hypothetical protein
VHLQVPSPLKSRCRCLAGDASLGKAPSPLLPCESLSRNMSWQDTSLDSSRESASSKAVWAKLQDSLQQTASSHILRFTSWHSSRSCVQLEQRTAAGAKCELLHMSA